MSDPQNVRQSDQEVADAYRISVAQVQDIQKARGLTNTAISQLSKKSVQRVLLKLEYTDRARAREEFRRLQEVDENGVYPPNALSRALDALSTVRSRGLSLQQIAGIPTGPQVQPRALAIPAPLAGLGAGRNWEAIGPGNMGGRTRAILVHPTQPDTLWAGSAGGGVWRTDDGGASWAPVDDFMANLAICCLVMDPTNPDILYAGTGEGFSNVDSLRGAGIFQTVDGQTWSQLPATKTENFHYVNRLAISPDGQVVLAATDKGLFRSTDAARANWQQVFMGQVADVKFHPTDNRKALAGTLRTGQALFSENGGQTWSVAARASAWSGRVEVTYAVGDPTMVYASVQMTRGEIWRSTDGGKSFTRRQNLTTDGEFVGYLGDQGWYDNVIWAGDPTNPNFVIVGGIDLWKSMNGGDTLVDITKWQFKDSMHADHHTIVAHPAFDSVNNKTLFFGNDGGIYKTTDIHSAGSNTNRTTGWRELVNTYGVTQFYAGAGNVQTGTIIGGAQDNGTLRFTAQGGSEKWAEMFGGDGGWCAADQTDPNHFYGEYVFLNIHRSSNSGRTAEFISGQFWNALRGKWDWKASPFLIPDAKNQQALFIAPFVLDPNDANRILGGGRSLWRTNDAKTRNSRTKGPSWQSIKGSIGTRISAIAIAQGNSNLVWVGYENGEVYRTVNGVSASPVWEKMDHTGAQPLAIDRYCTRITIDPANHNIVYATFGGYHQDNVWKSSDSGQTWSSISNGLPEAPVRTVVVHPNHADFLYIGTGVGVFASEDGGATWSPTNEGPTNCAVDELFWMGEMLVCATHGRGMFRINLANL